MAPLFARKEAICLRASATLSSTSGNTLLQVTARLAIDTRATCTPNGTVSAKARNCGCSEDFRLRGTSAVDVDVSAAKGNADTFVPMRSVKKIQKERGRAIASVMNQRYNCDGERAARDDKITATSTRSQFGFVHLKSSVVHPITQPVNFEYNK